MLLYTVTQLPPVWPGVRHKVGETSRFRANWSRTLDLLEGEIEKLRGSHVEFAVELPRGARDINNNGTLRADARPGRAVIVSFRIPSGSRLQFPADQYDWWQDNVHAVAMTLESMRAIDRWGVSQAKHYEGFKALPSTTAPTMDVHAAAQTIGDMTGTSRLSILHEISTARSAYRSARARAHPDAGGSAAVFNQVQEAHRVLSAHHGVTL